MDEPDMAIEPQYAREVFERLRQTLDVLLTDDSAIAWSDDNIAPNYELRDDGAWLRPSAVVDSLNWTPSCDLEESPTSPDPLTAPALPFPFTARQLAAFMLHGWGAFLAQRFAGEDEQIDLDLVQTLLGGVRDAKARKAIVEAFAVLAQAHQQVGEQDMTLAHAERTAMAVLDDATKEANRLHNWREPGISERERSARVRMRNEKTAAAKAAYKVAKEAHEKDEEAWRKAMVRWLLTPKPANATVDGPRINTGMTIEKERRQEERYQACVKAGLSMPSDDYSHLPRGVGKVAQSLGITRQALAEDVKAHIRRLNGR